ncbi:hypothetical protein AVEN_253895-1 [Araneus ventricosus]|uniref:Uncharacterized protein n=1 Tax=Araneus ventricosus TaxID=182803 RepID=A0A4Y2BRF8_ARAVE|nr:hypothetical protein AVEN_253895-1 [Araneus ventricosus]
MRLSTQHQDRTPPHIPVPVIIKIVAQVIGYGTAKHIPHETSWPIVAESKVLHDNTSPHISEHSVTTNCCLDFDVLENPSSNFDNPCVTLNPSNMHCGAGRAKPQRINVCRVN